MGVFFQPWWGSTKFCTTNSSVLQRCSPSFLLLPSLPFPRLVSSLQASMQQPAQTTHSVALAIPEIPGLEAHAAAENAQLARMGAPARPVGYQAHMAAEARLIQQQQQLADINNSYY